MSNLRALLVDDSLLMIETLRLAVPPDFFASIDYARNGEEAIQKYSANRPDFVTMDITMPQMDGLVCIRALRKQDPKARILVISALADNSKRIEAVSAGACGFLLKPVSSERLNLALSKIFPTISKQ